MQPSPTSRPPRRGRRADRRRQLVLRRRHPAARRTRRAASTTDGRRHQRRRVGLGRGYCLDDRRAAALRAASIRCSPRLRRECGDIAHPGRGRSAARQTGYLHCGASGAGHFVKMVHNGIEYGLMAAYAEGLGILKAPTSVNASDQAPTPRPRRCAPEHYRYRMNLPDIAEVWRRGSVISPRGCSTSPRRCWNDRGLAGFAGRVSDSGGPLDDQRRDRRAGAGTVPTTALYQRFSSRGEADFQNRCCRRRFQFGEVEKSADGAGPTMSRPAPGPPPTRWCSSAPPATWPSKKIFRRCGRWSAAATWTCR